MNKMSNKFVISTLLSVLAITWSSVAMAAADEHAAHHPATAAKAEDSATTPAESPGAAMANMEKMQAQMAAIRAAKDPKERARLMDEHMLTMQSTMQMMKQGSGCSMMEKDGMKGDMGMMHMMMEQMMQHQKAMQGSEK